MHAGDADAEAAGLPAAGERNQRHERGGVEKQGKLLGDCGLRHQPDADGTFKKKGAGNLSGNRGGNHFP